MPLSSQSVAFKVVGPPSIKLFQKQARLPTQPSNFWPDKWQRRVQNLRNYWENCNLQFSFNYTKYYTFDIFVYKSLIYNGFWRAWISVNQRFCGQNLGQGECLFLSVIAHLNTQSQCKASCKNRSTYCAPCTSFQTIFRLPIRGSGKTLINDRFNMQESVLWNHFIYKFYI